MLKERPVEVSDDAKPVVVAAGSTQVPRQPRWMKVVSIASLVASVALLVWAWRSGALQDVASLQAAIGGLGAWTVILFVLLQASQVIVPILPGGIGVVAGVILFGPVWGSVWNWLSICAGSLVAFGIARAHGPELLERRFSPRLRERYRSITDHRRFTVIFAALIAAPVAPDDFLCYLAGTTRMRWRTYTLIILLCKPWAILAYSFGLLALAQTTGVVR